MRREKVDGKEPRWPESRTHAACRSFGCSRADLALHAEGLPTRCHAKADFSGPPCFTLTCGRAGGKRPRLLISGCFHEHARLISPIHTHEPSVAATAKLVTSNCLGLPFLHSMAQCLASGSREVQVRQASLYPSLAPGQEERSGKLTPLRVQCGPCLCVVAVCSNSALGCAPFAFLYQLFDYGPVTASNNATSAPNEAQRPPSLAPRPHALLRLFDLVTWL